MKVVSVRKTTPPPLKTPRKFTVELTEGEADLILGLLGSSAVPKVGQSPGRYVGRLIRGFQHMLGQKIAETDAFRHSYGEVWFSTYNEVYRGYPLEEGFGQQSLY